MRPRGAPAPAELGLKRSPHPHTGVVFFGRDVDLLASITFAHRHDSSGHPYLHRPARLACREFIMSHATFTARVTNGDSLRSGLPRRQPR